MKKTTLLIMAAGLGSRFGGVKQMEPMGLNGEIIMDYSIHDAIEAGFQKVIIVLRRDIIDDFQERFGERIADICRKKNVELVLVTQNMEDVPAGYTVPEGRVKPWGTCQAVLAAREYLKEPFLVVNADDYYGKEAYSSLHRWLEGEHADTAIAMAGFILKNTLSENGGVTRGVCTVNPGHSHVVDVVETRNIVKTPTGAIAGDKELDLDSYVSMNMWAFPAKEGCRPHFVDVLEKEFVTFFERVVPGNPMTSEYLLPTLIGGMLRSGECAVSVLETGDKWFGVTYKDDIPTVKQSIQKLITTGVYAEDLYSDLI